MNKFVLAILDGVGISGETFGNAVSQGRPKFFDKCLKTFPNVLLNASGEFVGLPEGQMGNSEVGHLNIGAGRIVPQTLLRINKLIENGEFFSNEILNKLFVQLQSKKRDLHLVGMISDGGVHSHINHLFAILDLAQKYKISNIYIHTILDGRDTKPCEALKFLKLLEEKIAKQKNVSISTVCGRYFAMDRENHWDRTSLAYKAIAEAKGTKYSCFENFFSSSKQKVYDEFVQPFIADDEYKGVQNGDTILFFNFRPDRMRQIVSAFANSQLNVFEHNFIDNLEIYTLTNYDKDMKNFGIIPIFDDEIINNTLTEVLVKNGKKVLKVAETTKYAHVTYFLNGGKEKPFDNESRVLIPSEDVATYDLSPKMRAKEIANVVIDSIKKDTYDAIILNFANGDMVGHTGNFKATKKAIKFVSKQLERIYKACEKKGYVLIFTADHGNAEKMIDKNGQPWTAHTLNLVPFVICSNNYNLIITDKKFSLSNIAPTVLDILGIKIPKEMDSKSLLLK